MGAPPCVGAPWGDGPPGPIPKAPASTATVELPVLTSSAMPCDGGPGGAPGPPRPNAAMSTATVDAMPDTAPPTGPGAVCCAGGRGAGPGVVGGVGARKGLPGGVGARSEALGGVGARIGAPAPGPGPGPGFMSPIPVGTDAGAAGVIGRAAGAAMGAGAARGASNCEGCITVADSSGSSSSIS